MNYRKAIMAILATVFTALMPVMINGFAHITPAQWINVAIAGITAAMVFAAPNVPGARYTKSIIAVLMAVLGFAVTVVVPCASFINCHIAGVDWIQMGILALNALGVYAVKNESS